MTELALEQTLDLGDYLAAFRRRRGMILMVAGIIFMLGLISEQISQMRYDRSEEETVC